MEKSHNMTVKEYLEQYYLLDGGFWYETRITSTTPWLHITLHQLFKIAAALDEDVCDIINHSF